MLSDLIDGCEILTSVMKTTRGIIYTSCSTNDCALLSKSFGGEVVTIPSLAECKTEIKHVANGILVDCLAVFNLKENCLDETHYSFLEEVGWPENFKQLESVSYQRSLPEITSGIYTSRCSKISLQPFPG